MRNRRNYYRVLHVQRDAPSAVLKSSYRALMKSLEMHPDRGGEHWNAAAINEAYAVLSDPVRRTEYDRGLGSHSGIEGRTPAGSASPNRVEAPTDAMDTCCVFCGSARGAVRSAPDAELCLECRSPMTPAGAPQLEASGRRAARRVARHGAIAYYTDWPQPATGGQIIDLSPGGLKFRSSRPVDLFQIVKIDGPLLDAVARVVSCREIRGQFTIGLQFYTVHFHSPRGTFLSTRA